MTANDQQLTISNGYSRFCYSISKEIVLVLRIDSSIVRNTITAWRVKKIANDWAG